MIETPQFVIPHEGAGFLRGIDSLRRSGPFDDRAAVSEVLDAFASGRVSYVGGGAFEAFPDEGLDLMLNHAVRCRGGINTVDTGTAATNGNISTHTNAAPPAITTDAPHKLANGDIVRIAGHTPTALNGVWAVTVTGASTFTIPLNAAPGAQSVAGTWRVVGSAMETLYLMLFNSPAINTMPSQNAKLTGGAGSPYTSGTTPPVEVVNSGSPLNAYARTAVDKSAWGAQATNGSGRRSSVSAPGSSFPESGNTYGTTVKGFGLVTALASTAQDTGVAIFYANFDDQQAIDVNAAGYTVRVAPYIQFDA